jgi:glyoxylase-like metal-dependent hydrolase (beta-lactamase superfamily II)
MSTTPQLGSTMRVLRPAPNVFAFYDGRGDGVRLYSPGPNWLDDGAYSLGVATYAIVAGAEALVYDTHISLAHAEIVRRTLEESGVRSIRVVLSHWHGDHVAGNSVFADCEIIANALTAATLAERRHEMEEEDDPPIKPLVMPNRTFEGELKLTVGDIPVELRQIEIHSRDGTVLVLPETGLLFAGDTLEDPVTYVSEAERLPAHLDELRRMAGWEIRRILPNHGSPEAIAGGGYDKRFIEATRRYVEKLMRCRTEPELAEVDLRSFAGELFAGGAVAYFAPYEDVHRKNVAAVRAVA